MGEQERILELYSNSAQNQKTSVDYLLTVGVLFCAHRSQEKQIRELWHLANKELESTVDAEAILQLVTNLVEIVISKAK